MSWLYSLIIPKANSSETAKLFPFHNLLFQMMGKIKRNKSRELFKL